MNKCLHCLQNSYNQKFCCNGCETAYHLIKNSNLNSYYKKRVANKNISTKPVLPIDIDFSPYITIQNDKSQANFIVDGIHCAACIWLIEQMLLKNKAVEYARVNMTTKRLKVIWNNKTNIQEIVKIVSSLGYRLMPYDPKILENQDNKKQKELLIYLAVAGFVSSNVMLLSIATWSGDMGQATISLMQWFSALLALPGIVYAGQPFYKSAINAIKHKHMNMDVPISLAVILTTSLSFYEMVTKSGETFFESAIMLLFFLLIGRYLEQKIQIKSRSIIESLAGLQITSATILQKDKLKAIPVKNLKVGDILVVATGEKCAADGVIISGNSSIDTSMLTGENMPVPVSKNSFVQSGSINTGNIIHIKITAVGDKTSLAQISDLVEKSIQNKHSYTPLVDKVSRFYAPVVHSLALVTFIGWLISGASIHDALIYAIAVLIITCPCAIALAVPAVNVATASSLFKNGIILRNSNALEKLLNIKKVVFDKTGTLTTGTLTLLNKPKNKNVFGLMASMALNSKHPLSKALVKAYEENISPLKNVKEIAGEGLKAKYKNTQIYLGNAKFCKVDNIKSTNNNQLFFNDGKKIYTLEFSDTLRLDAKKAIHYLQKNNYQPIIISGDTEKPVKYIADKLKITDYYFSQSPQSKYNILTKSINEKVLMVGDGINDAPSLAKAYVSMAPASASDMAQVTADIIFQGKSLMAVPLVIATAKKACKVIKLNFTFAIIYNLIAIPLAILGYVNPLFAAVFMSASSISVMLNALRMTKEVKV